MALVRIEELKTELQSLGVRVSPPNGAGCRVREGGAGPAEGTTLVLGGTPVSVPAFSDFVSASPFRLEQIRGHWALFRGDERIHLPVTLPPAPPFYRKSTAEGVPYRKIALMHGVDCLCKFSLKFDLRPVGGPINALNAIFQMIEPVAQRQTSPTALNDF